MNTVPVLVIRNSQHQYFAALNKKASPIFVRDISCARHYTDITRAADQLLELQERGLIGLTLAQERAEVEV